MKADIAFSKETTDVQLLDLAEQSLTGDQIMTAGDWSNAVDTVTASDVNAVSVLRFQHFAQCDGGDDGFCRFLSISLLHSPSHDSPFHSAAKHAIPSPPLPPQECWSGLLEHRQLSL